MILGPGFVTETDGVLPAPLVPGDLGEKGVAHRVHTIMDEDAVGEIFVATFYGEVIDPPLFRGELSSDISHRKNASRCKCRNNGLLGTLSRK